MTVMPGPRHTIHAVHTERCILLLDLTGHQCHWLGLSPLQQQKSFWVWMLMTSVQAPLH